MLSDELREITFEMTRLGYERRTAYEEFAPLQLARESARTPSPRCGPGNPCERTLRRNKADAIYGRPSQPSRTVTKTTGKEGPREPVK